MIGGVSAGRERERDCGCERNEESWSSVHCKIQWNFVMQMERNLARRSSGTRPPR